MNIDAWWVNVLAGLTVSAPLFFIGVASPGPGTLAVMSTSMRLGRGQGVALGLGISTGSLFWGVVSALGLGGILSANESASIVLRVAGSVYFLWLAFKLGSSDKTVGLILQENAWGKNKRTLVKKFEKIRVRTNTTQTTHGRAT